MSASKKLCGIWIDTKQAFIMQFEGSRYFTQSILSDIEDFHPIGGSRSKSPWGPMEKVSESKYLERRKHQEKSYFERIYHLVKECKPVLLFGPAEIKFKLRDYLVSQHIYTAKDITVENADSMTDPQKLARVRTHFGLPTKKVV